VSVSSQEIEVKFTIAIPEIDEAQRLEAERKAREAFIMELLRQGNISAGRAAELLSIERWQLSDLMGLYRISPFAPQTPEELEREVAEAEPNDQILADLKDSLRQVKAGQTFPMSELWDGIDV
jgi:predicted HTH domain antitoxin